MKRALIFILFMAVLGYAQGQVMPDSLANDTLAHVRLNHEVEVTSARYESRTFDRAEFVTFLDDEALRQYTPVSLPDALHMTPGVFMQKTNHGGGSLFIRGLSGYNTLILVDGIRLNNTTFRVGPNQYLNTIDPLSIAHSEVMRGAGSVQYGSDAVGGVVHLMTKDPTYAFESPRVYGEVYTKAMTQHMDYTGRVELGFSTAKLAMIGGYSRKRFGNIVAGGGIGELDPTGFREQDVDVKLKYRTGRHSELTTAFQWVRQNNVPLYHQIANNRFDYFYYDPQRRTMAYARYQYFSPNNNWVKEFRVTAGGMSSQERRLFKKPGPPNLQVTEQDDVNTQFATVELVSEPFAGSFLSMGTEVYNDMVESTSYVYDIDSLILYANLRGRYPQAQSLNAAVYVMQTLALSRWRLNAGLRYQYYNVSTNSAGNELNRTYQITPSKLVYQASGTYSVNPWLNLVGGINTSFRAPNVNDMASIGVTDFRYEVANFNLRPENAQTAELGVKLRKQRWAANVTLYQTRLTDLVVSLPRGDTIESLPVFKRENVGQARIRGFEADAEVMLTDDISLYGHTVFTHGQDLSNGQPMRRIPPIHGRLGGQWIAENKDAWARADMLWATRQARLSPGDIVDERIPDGGTPGWVVLNVHAGYQVKPWLGITVAGLNLLNEAYRTHGSGVEGVGRSAHITARFSFGT